MKGKTLLPILSATIALTGISTTVQAQSGENNAGHARTRQMVMQIVKDNRSLAGIQNVALSTGQAQKHSRRLPMTTPAKGSTGDVLHESFEGWDGETADWLPETWSEKVSDNALTSINDNSTWHVDRKQLYHPEPVEGQYYATINAAITNEGETKINLPQDEWLITPEFIPASGTRFLYNVGLAPFFLYDTEKFDWEKGRFSNREVTATLQLMIQADGGEWTQLWDACNEFKDTPDKELCKNGVVMKFYHYSTDMTPYAGKKVKMAFRYVGQGGNAMDIDRVRVGVPEPIASYKRPQGAFYFGLTDDYDDLDISEQFRMLLPPYTDVTWSNKSSIESESFVWNFQNADGSDGTSTERDLKQNYAINYASLPNYRRMPQLTANAPGAPGNAYSWGGEKFQVGGQATVTLSDGEKRTCSVGNYDLNNNFYALQGAPGKFMFGHCEGTDSLWTDLLGEETHLKAVCNFFEMPAHPYALSRVTVMATGEIQDDAELSLRIQSVDEDGRFDLELARATCKASDIKVTEIEGVKYLAMPFDLFSVGEDEDGEEVLKRDTLTIETPILVTVMGFNKLNSSNFGFFQSGADPHGETNGYFILSEDEENEEDGDIYPLSAVTSKQSGACYSSFLFNLDANYSWMEDTDENLTRNWIQLYEDMYINAMMFNVPGEGGTVEFNLVASEDPAQWKEELLPVTDDYPQPEDETPTWLTAKKEGDKAHAKITFDVQANDTGEAREAYYYAYIPGSRVLYLLHQEKASAVRDIMDTHERIRVTVVGGDFLVAGPNGGQVSVFDTTGRLVAQSVLQGDTVIKGEQLPHGVYVLRFGNGVAVKVMK